MADQNVVPSKEMSEFAYGILFDFMGYCTTRQTPLIFSASHNCVPAVEVITNFFQKRRIGQCDPNFDWDKLCIKTEIPAEQVNKHSQVDKPLQVDKPSQAQTDEIIHMDVINNMSHYDMCFLWRYARPGHIYFDRTLPYNEVFEDRLFNHFDGFSPAMRKQLGYK